MPSKKIFVSWFSGKKLWLLALFVVLIILGVALRWERSSQNVAVTDVVLLSGLVDVPLSGMTTLGEEVSVPLPSPSVTERDHDQWILDEESLAYWSVSKQGVTAHEGTLAVRGMLLADLTKDGGVSLYTGLSHITLLMDSLAVSGFASDGIAALFLDHVLGEEFLETDTYPFAQFVLDSIEPQGQGEEGERLFRLGGRLKVKDVIEPIFLDDVVVRRESDRLLFVSGRFSLSRYLWGLSLMPTVVDEFIDIDFDRGLSL